LESVLFLNAHRSLWTAKTIETLRRLSDTDRQEDDIEPKAVGGDVEEMERCLTDAEAAQHLAGIDLDDQPVPRVEDNTSLVSTH
jgi:hypothetical protein